VTNPKTGRLVNYAAIVEAKYPYMRPAFDEVKATIAEMIKARVVEGVTS
jgi:2C-methyl-D-erythritol 2,4-cyclodiphosphate synthase